jgi:pimeloyl-ACP methyl ester carboxylesterase
MEPVFQSMDAKWQRIYFDLPGMGRTPGKPWITGSDQMLEVVLAFIDAVIPNRHFLVAGQSYGGYLARGVVNKRAAMVDGLLLICPMVDERTRLAHAPAHQVLEKDETLLQSLSKEEREGFESIGVVLDRWSWERYRNEVLPGLKLADQEFLSKYLGQNVPYSFELEEPNQPFLKPTLMVAGRQDAMVGYRDLWSIIESYPRASYLLLDKAGHSLHIEQDRLFSELVKEWLGRLPETRNS